MDPRWRDEPYKTGVVQPYFWNTEENECYYLFGQDAKKKDNPKAVGDNDWSAFGGFRELSEFDPVVTAIREATEESIDLLANLKTPLLNKRCVEVITTSFKQHMFIVNLFPGNAEEPCYSEAEINAFSTEFDKLLLQKLNPHQKEKLKIGWIKANDIAEKILFDNPRFTIYEQPSQKSFVLTKNASMRRAQKDFFKNVNNFLQGIENIRTGWRNLEGQVQEIDNRKNKPTQNQRPLYNNISRDKTAQKSWRKPETQVNLMQNHQVAFSPQPQIRTNSQAVQLQPSGSSPKPKPWHRNNGQT